MTPLLILLIISNMLLWYALVKLIGVIRDLTDKENEEDDQP